MNVTIIYLEDQMLMSRKEYRSWREVQDEYKNYKASLGPWSIEEVIDYLSDEYSDLDPRAEIQASELLNGPNETVRLTFNDFVQRSIMASLNNVSRKDSMKVVAEGRNYWILYKDDEQYILTVLCGSIGLYTYSLALSDLEVAEYLAQGDKAIDSLARAVSGNPRKYQSRDISGFSLREEVRLADQERREDHP